jgi:hypothetical protein
MGIAIVSLAALIVIGVVLAMMIKNWHGTKAFFNGLGQLWGRSINGLLGKPSKV